MAAEQIIGSAERRSPGLVTLALLLSPAVRIEPELIRAVRLDLLPKLPAGTEGELWFSPLVSARGLDGIVLDAAVANLLRSWARAILLPEAHTVPPPASAALTHVNIPTQDDIQRAWRLIEQIHAASPPVLRLEETVNWLAVSQANPETGIETQLQSAVEALRRGRTGVARWAARALPRMPDAARSTTAAWLLAQGAGRRLGSREWGTRTPDIARIDDLAALLPPRYDVPLGVRRLGSRLDLGDVGRDGVSIRVLDTDPRVLAVSIPEGEVEQIVQVPRGARVSLDVWSDPVALRTPRGETYQVEPVPVDVISELIRSCVIVEREGAEELSTLGIAVAADRVLTVLPLKGTGGLVTIRGSSPVRVTGEVTAAREPLALVRVTHLPEGVQPVMLPWAPPPPLEVGPAWYGLTGEAGQAWSTIAGVIGEAVDGVLTATPVVPIERPMSGGPVVVDGVVTGLITSVTSGGSSFYVQTAGVADLLGLDQEPDRLSGLTSAANAIALEFHMSFEGFRRASGTELDTDALMAAAGLAADQLGYVRGAAEFVIKSGIEARTRPRWLPPSGLSGFSAAVLAAFDEASGAWGSLSQFSQRLTLSKRRFSLTAGARQDLAETGVTLVPSASGGVDAALDAGRFTSGGLHRLRAVLAGELPAFDQWDPWSRAPAAGADRSQVLLEVIAELCRRSTGVLQSARTVLAAADDHLYPRWWQVRDDLVRVGVPDVGADQDFPDFLEAYLGWCLTVLHQVGTSAGDYRYHMGYAIPPGDAAVLPTTRFELETLPAPSSGADVLLAGPFSALVGFSAWVFLELADQVRLTAAQPPPWLLADQSRSQAGSPETPPTAETRPGLETPPGPETPFS